MNAEFIDVLVKLGVLVIEAIGEVAKNALSESDD